MKEKLTQERLKELLDYNPETGIFTWKISIGTSKKYNVAGSLDRSKGYYKISVNYKKYYVHRLAFLWMEGYFPENEVDHLDRDRLNNKWNNIKEVSVTCNARNRNIFKNNKSGITGIYWNKEFKKWSSSIRIKKLIHLGYFDNIIDAAKARWNAEIKYNFPNCNTTSSAYNYLKEHGAI